MSRSKQNANLRLAFLGLTLYLLLFSGFAEFHAYANNELGETTCAIGLWVQQGQAILLGVFLLSVTLICLPYHPLTSGFSIREPAVSTLMARAPPRSSYQ